MYKDSAVQTKLNIIAANDPYFTTEMPTSPAMKRYLLREFAERVLNPPIEELYVVTRTADKVCRVQHQTDTLSGEAIIGPETADFVRRVMCDHTDSSAQGNPALCGRVEPTTACQR